MKVFGIDSLNRVQEVSGVFFFGKASVGEWAEETEDLLLLRILVRVVAIFVAMVRKNRGRIGRFVQRIALAISPPLEFVSQVKREQLTWLRSSRTWQMSIEPERTMHRRCRTL